MEHKISLRTVGIIIGISTVVAFLFGIIISAGIPRLANRGEAQSAESIYTPLVTEAGESPFSKVAALVSSAVVNISAEKVVKGGYPYFEWKFEGPFDEFFRDFFKNFPKSEGRTHTLGSGFIISKDGYVVTNYHVIKDASEIIIRLVDKKEFKGSEVKIIGFDQRTDIALLKIEGKEEFPHLKFGDSDKVKVGDWAIAVGNPFQLEGTVTVGVISAKGRANIPLPEGPDFQGFLQTDAAINPGNSGGPLVNIHGEVIGINTAITSPSGGNVGIGFAIPVNLAHSVIDELKDKGRVTRGYLGIYLQEITEDLKKGLHLPNLKGVLLSEVISNTPASKAGLKNGDVIIKFDGNEVKDVQSFRIQVAATPPGKSVPIRLIRNGKEKEILVKIGEYPEKLASKVVPEEKLGIGLRVADLSDPEASRFNLNMKNGVVVLNVKPKSTAADAGIAVGDVIISIDKREIRNLSDYNSAVSKLKKGRPVIFQIQRGERKRYVAVTPD